MYCNAVHDWKGYHEKHDEKFWREAAERDTSQPIFVDTRWVVLYSSEDQKVPIERIRDCLDMLNTVYSGANKDELAMVPNTARNPWQPRIGVPNIQFLPLDSSTLQVEYRQVSGFLDPTNPVQDAAAKGDVTPDVLNIYLGACGQGCILGQAEIRSNVVYAMYSTIGGYNVPGAMPGYDLGKTVAHEVGHALGLVHTFADTVCDGQKPYSDVPEQIRPNFDTALTQLGDGTYDQINDNRYKDRINNTHLSCLHTEGDPDAADNEMGVNIMDYGNDRVSLMFTQNQVQLMRHYLEGPDNTTLKLQTADATSISAGTATDKTNTQQVAPLPSPTTSDGGMSTTVIVIICVFSGLVAIVLIWLVYKFRYSKPTVAAVVAPEPPSTGSRKKRSDAFVEGW